MADISYIKIIDGTTHSIRDIGVPELPQTTDVFLRGDGAWAVPTAPSLSDVSFTDGGDYLLITKPE